MHTLTEEVALNSQYLIDWQAVRSIGKRFC